MRQIFFNKGFSLIEIMIVIVIISILTSLAAVSYRSYIVKARRTAVQEELLKYQQSMEEYFSLNHTYGSSSNAATCANIFPSDKKSSEGFYTLSCTLDGGYKLAATATGSQAKDDADCVYLYLFRNGSRGGGKSSSSVSSNACW